MIVMIPAFVPEVQALLVRADLPKVTSVTARLCGPQCLDAGGSRGARRAEVQRPVHGAVRPLLSSRVVRDCVEALQTYEAVDVMIPWADAVVCVDDDEQVAEIPDRSHLRRGRPRRGRACR